MIDLIVKAAGAHLPPHPGRERYVGLLTTAVPDYAATPTPPLTDLESDIDRAMRVWRWTWTGVAVCRFTGPQTTAALRDVVEVSRLDPAWGQSAETVAAVRDWLDARFSEYVGTVKGDADPAVAAAALRTAIDFQCAPDDPRNDGTPKPSMLGFVANLASVMVPVPQIGGLAHVAYDAQGELGGAGDTFFVLVPLFDLPWDEQTRITVTRAEVAAVCPPQADLRTPIELRIEFDQAQHRSVVLRCAAISAAPAAAAPGMKLSPLTLWSDVTLAVGAHRLGLRDVCGGGFELLDAALRAVDDYAFFPELDPLRELGARLVRDLVLLDDNAPRHLLLDVIAAADGTSAAGGGALSAGAADLLAVYQTFYGNVSGDSSTARAEWRRMLDRVVREIKADTTVVAEIAPWQRTLAADAEAGYPRVMLRAQGGASGPRALRLVVDAEPTAGVTYGLQRWDSAVGAWVPSGATGLGPIGVSAGAKQFEVDVMTAAAAGLPAGRYQLVATPPGTPVARFVLSPDEGALRLLRRLAAILSTPEGHASVVVGILRAATLYPHPAAKDPLYGRAQAHLGQIEGRLLNEVLPRKATRAIVRDHRLQPFVTAAIAGIPGGPADRQGRFSAAVLDYARRMLDTTTAPALPQAVQQGVEVAVASHAAAYLQHAAPVSSGVTSTPAPLEIEVETPLGDHPEFDDPASPEMDPLAWIAGIGVLLRRVDGQLKQWRCLNAAKLTGLGLNGVVPLPIAYEDGIATAAMRYDGIPFAARGELSSDVHGLVSDDGLRAQVLVKYEMADDTKEWAKPLMLVDGTEYEACGFAIHQTGVLPAEIANPDAPWLVADAALAADIAGIPPCAPVIYRRTVPVGAPPVELSKSAGGPYLALTDPTFRVPAGVTPLARDFVRTAVTAGGPSRAVFGSLREGVLPLADGPWSLTVAGIEARGFAGAATLRIEPRPAARTPATALLIVVDGNTVSVRITVNGQVTELASSGLGGRPATVVLRLVPGADTGAANGHLDVRIWAADALEPESPATRCALPPGAEQSLRRPGASFVFSAEGVGADGATVASIAFNAPKVDSVRGLTTALNVADAPVALLKPTADTRFVGILERLGLRARPPAVDHACWDHRAAAAQLAETDTTLRDRLIQHRGAVHGGWLIGLEVNETVRARNPLATARDVIDLSLDDPSVDALLIEAIPIFAPRAARAVRQVARLEPSWVRPVAPSDPTKDVREQVADLLAGARVRESLLPEWRVDSGGTIAPNPGEVWEISVRALVREDEKDLLSADVAALLAPYTDTGQGGSRVWLAGPAQRILVEVAANPVGTVPELSFDAIRAALWPRVHGRNVEVAFAPGRLVTQSGVPVLDEAAWAWRGRQFAYLRDATLARQAWRWTGRPLDPYPFDRRAKYEEAVNLAATGPTYLDTELRRIGPALRWEVAAFGDRDDADYLTTDHVLRPFARTDLRREPLDGDGRAHHWRFRLTVRSRYAALMTDPRLREITGPPQDAPLHDRWQRAFAPVAPPPIVKPPAVRLFLPLTESIDDAATADRRPPPVLAVLDDAWFDVGGVAEELLVDVEQTAELDVEEKATDGSVRTRHIPSLQEFGPDPIRAATPWSAATKIMVRPVGPIGYTYDAEATAPRFAHSSFILEVATVGAAVPIPDWAFARPSLRRVLAPEAVDGYQPPTTDVPRATPKPFAGAVSGAARFIDVDVRGTEAREVVLSLVVELRGSRVIEPEPVRVRSAAALRVTLERIAVYEDQNGPQAIWQLEVRPRDAATEAVETRIRARGTAAVSPDAPILSLSWDRAAGAAQGIVSVMPGTSLYPYLVSRPTPATWTQFTADSSRFFELGTNGPRVVRTSELAVRFENQSWTVVRRTDLRDEVRLGPYDPFIGSGDPAPSFLRSGLWVVATERVMDAARRMTERYVGLFRIPPGSATLVPTHPRTGVLPAFTNPSFAVFRILEVERREDGGAEDWSLLWPPKAVDGGAAASNAVSEPAEALARISKVSKPIPGVSI